MNLLLGCLFVLLLGHRGGILLALCIAFFCWLRIDKLNEMTRGGCELFFVWMVCLFGCVCLFWLRPAFVFDVELVFVMVVAQCSALRTALKTTGNVVFEQVPSAQH